MKICIEGPHVSEADSKQFLTKEGTYFNPVFVATEVPRPAFLPRDWRDRFQILARKSYEGQPSIHLESVLYELLGNHISSNLIFVEVSRKLFNPHKSYRDGN